MNERKVIQIAVSATTETSELVALCDDGSMWWMNLVISLNGDVAWQRSNWESVPDVPKAELPQAKLQSP